MDPGEEPAANLAVHAMALSRLLYFPKLLQIIDEQLLSRRYRRFRYNCHCSKSILMVGALIKILINFLISYVWKFLIHIWQITIVFPSEKCKRNIQINKHTICRLAWRWVVYHMSQRIGVDQLRLHI